MLLLAFLSAFVGTAVMTLSSTTEMILEGREESTTPGKAALKLLKVFGVENVSDKTFALLSLYTHWIYGTAWGIFLYAFFYMNFPPVLLWLPYWIVVWCTEQVLLPAMGVAEASWAYGKKALITDIFHHLVYAIAATICWFIVI